SGWFTAAQQQVPGPNLASPLPGQALQGVISIQGTSAVDGFAWAQIEFRYENDPTQTWFLIQDNIPAIENDVLASWDTTTITDGVYRVRLTVSKTDGSMVRVEAAGLRVRNYSAVETSTPAALPNETSQPSATVSATAAIAHSTPTPQPPNPVSVTLTELTSSLAAGLSITGGLFLLFAIYRGLRHLVRR
ncbi:MAG: hypothetical protein AAGU05_15440, partial [Anaerolineaceae bacterium]